MNRVVQMVKTLQEAAKPASVNGFSLRSFDDPRDLAGWLALRQRAFAREKLGVRDWEAADFHQEFFSKPWWNPQHCWLIETNPLELAAAIPILSPPTPTSAGSQIVASVTLAMRKGVESDRAVVHWLMVHPRYRSHGLGRWLLAVLEATAWELDHREVYLETHSAWEAATRFYYAAGYQVAPKAEAE